MLCNEFGGGIMSLMVSFLGIGDGRRWKGRSVLSLCFSKLLETISILLLLLFYVRSVMLGFYYWLHVLYLLQYSNCSNMFVLNANGELATNQPSTNYGNIFFLQILATSLIFQILLFFSFFFGDYDRCLSLNKIIIR